MNNPSDRSGVTGGVKDGAISGSTKGDTLEAFTLPAKHTNDNEETPLKKNHSLPWT